MIHFNYLDDHDLISLYLRYSRIEWALVCRCAPPLEMKWIIVEGSEQELRDEQKKNTRAQLWHNGKPVIEIAKE